MRETVKGSPVVVSIGIPVFNSSETIRRALESVVTQSYRNLDIIISDNFSSDGTYEICKEFSLIDSRIRLYKQNINIGGEKNFEFTLNKAQGKYFMWFAGDDVRSQNFIEVNLEALEQNQNFIASTSPDLFDNQDINVVSPSSSSLSGTVIGRFREFFSVSYRSHGLFYSLIRTETLRKCNFIEESFFAWDWAIVLFLASQGEIHRANKGLATFGVNGLSATKKIYVNYNLRGFRRVFPFMDFNFRIMGLVSNFSLQERIMIFTMLAKLNGLNLIHEFRAIRYFASSVKSKFSKW